MPMTTMLNVTMKNITDVINITSGDPVEVLINVNHVIYGGWYTFIIMCLLGFILFKLSQRKENQPLVNAMKVSTVLTILSFFLRAMSLVKYGVVWGMLTDFQMWIFPLLAAILATINKYLSP